MKFSRKIAPELKTRQNFITKKRLREDEINFDKLRSYRLDRVRKELVKNNLEACILFDPVNVRYALDTVNMSVYNMHNLTRYCFVPVNGPTILYEYFNCEILSKHLNLIDEIRPAITWDYFSNGDQANTQLEKWINEVYDLSKNYFKSKKIAIDVLNGPAVTALNKKGIEVVDAKLILEQARVIKSPDELICMKAAIEVAEEGVSKMRPIKGGVIVKAGESLEFKPMGYHLMFFDINEKLIEGELMNAYFRFKNSKDLLVKFKLESNKSSHEHEH